MQAQCQVSLPMTKFKPPYLVIESHGIKSATDLKSTFKLRVAKAPMGSLEIIPHSFCKLQHALLHVGRRARAAEQPAPPRYYVALA
jgi:hypothetical protein